MASGPLPPLPDGVREVREADTGVGPPAPAEADVRAGYRVRLADAIRARLGLSGAIFLACVGAACGAEHWFHPERSPAVWVAFACWVVSWVLAMTLCHVPRFALLTPWVSAALAVLVSVTMNAYARYVGGELELFTMAQLCLVCGLAAFVPWGWRPQLLVSVVAGASLAAAAPSLPSALHPFYCALALLTGIVTSLAGAVFFERICFAEFLRSAHLAHASAQHREEAEIAGALLQVAREVHTHLEREDIVPHVSRLAVGVLGCDDCHLYLWDDARGRFRLHAHAGLPPDVRARIADVDFGPDDPLFSALRPGALCEIADAARRTPGPCGIARLVDCGALLALPICRRAERIGMLVFAWRRPFAFSRREHRLAFGIAHAATVALENARLVGEITAASRLKSQFLSTMSHELRTPLNVICGYADILAEGGFGPLDREQRRAVAGIRRSTRLLVELVDAGNDLERIETGRDVVVANVVDLDELFAEVRRDLGAVDTTAVALRWRNGLGSAPVRTDRAKLKVILKHLVENALKFTEQGEVNVVVDETAAGLVVQVRDTGIGIAPGDLGTIFEMFRQVDASETRRFGGVGLGLHVVARLVQRLGGTVAVESTPGAGSVFTVTLPSAGAVDQSRGAGASST